ncbi:polyamine-transporting ATPase 13A3-like isoform X1 [Tigriopus californicus]|uniref:polyamine-transporting ATPase 13A3-like isoform X1 n=1 Tax=Tigriopus californicus TaxID=6832 RepID=UPI0027DA9CF6|nr:polyamine-transporting ATPase 13A3-like isoform X1 [Tigriopus californicus]|eukprot:TCALIF_07540-PA protein Name:"Similar to ATP13A3 Probable cation-transporting ATPase 13A3 (Homo sapiens)" AED:0.12 eAED:0.12 QI:561/1/1/1/0.78/0.85/20/72/1324
MFQILKTGISRNRRNHRGGECLEVNFPIGTLHRDSASNQRLLASSATLPMNMTELTLSSMPDSRNSSSASFEPGPSRSPTSESDLDLSQAVLNKGDEEEMLITGYETVPWRLILVWLGKILSLGLFWLLLYWVPRWELFLTSKRTILSKANQILVKEEYKGRYCRYYVKAVKTVKASKSASDNVTFDIPNPFGPGHRSVHSYKYFNCKKVKYIWDENNAQFFPLSGMDHQMPISVFHAQTGLHSAQQIQRRSIYGNNAIVIPKRNILYLLIKEVLNPFYVFQIASVLLWFLDEYIYYAAAIVIMSAGGITTAVYQTKKNEKRLRSTVMFSDTVEVFRGNDLLEVISSDDLVPGDIITIPSHGCDLHCDAVLISGNAIVNEAMLTGESVPVTKTMLPKGGSEIYDGKEHSRSTLFGGTRVIQTRQYKGQKVLAVVVRTGFATTKGKLVRTILYPAPVDFKFEQDSYKFVGFLGVLAAAGFIYTCVTQLMDGESIKDIALDALDLITIVVPPALPAAMTIGSIYAQKRLQRKGIFCISPRNINVSGSVDCVCFDKTGTLTEDGLDMWGVIPVKQGSDEKDPKFADHEKTPSNLDKGSELIRGMATCHSLTIIDGELSGDPLDLKMFESTGWILEEPTGNSSEMYDQIAPTVVRPPEPPGSPKRSESDLGDNDIGIIRQFPFSSNRQCMSVIVRRLPANPFTVFCKGSPEKIASICVPETIPKNFHEVLQEYTQKGYRVIALARRYMVKSLKITKIERMEREEVEQSLVFVGLIILDNRLKEETTPIIEQLQNARLRTIMVTGDNVNTALSVAKECKIIPYGRVIMVHAFFPDPTKPICPKVEFTLCDTVSGPKPINGMKILDMDDRYHMALDGSSFEIIRLHFPEVLDRVTVRGAVFARMSPEQKQILVEHLQELGYCVAMCGDGANDCGALKAAHTGISLSEAESSVASPFTSKEPNISCMPELIKEGRCALVTSFGIFKYMAAYSLTQFTTVLILYSIDSNLSDIQFLYIDLFLITVFAFFFGLTEAFEGDLAPHPPMKSLISFTPILSLLLQMVIIISFQCLAFFYVQSQEWFVPFDGDNPTYNGTKWEDYYQATTIEDSEVACWENYAVFTISAFQYIILAYAFSKSSPYRKMIYTNLWFIASLLFMTAFTLYIVLYPSYYFQSSFETLLPPIEGFRFVMIGFVVANVVICVLTEDYFMEFVIFRHCRKSCHNHEKSKRVYLSVDKWMKNTPSWPPISSRSSRKPIRDTPTDSSPIDGLTVVTEVVRNDEEAFQEMTGNHELYPKTALAENSHIIAAAILNSMPNTPTKSRPTSEVMDIDDS